MRHTQVSSKILKPFDMDDAWSENVDTTASLLAKRIIQDDDDVKDSWEDEDEDIPPPPPPQPQTSSAPKEAKKSTVLKAKAKTKDDAIPVEETTTLTPQELEEIQRRSDLEHVKDAFGLADEQKSLFSSYEPSTRDDFKSYCQFLVEQINKHNKKKEYFDFLSELFRSLSLELDSEHVKRYGKELSVLAIEMQKREKENEKQQKLKAPKKPTIAVGKRAMLDDIADADGFYGGDDDEDFM